MATLTNPKTGVTITVPDNVEVSYTSRGWVAPGTPAPAEPVADDSDGREPDEPQSRAGRERDSSRRRSRGSEDPT